MSKALEKAIKHLASQRSTVKQHGRKKDEQRERKSEGGRTWIQEAIKQPGALHAELHIPEDKKIPQKRLVKAEHSTNPTLRKRAFLAETLSKLHKK